MMDPRFNAFYLLTGFTFLAFASGFGVCLFDINQIDACVEAANKWVDIFMKMGNHLIEWAIALVNAAFGR